MAGDIDAVLWHRHTAQPCRMMQVLHRPCATAVEKRSVPNLVKLRFAVVRCRLQVRQQNVPKRACRTVAIQNAAPIRYSQQQQASLTQQRGAVAEKAADIGDVFDDVARGDVVNCTGQAWQRPVRAFGPDNVDRFNLADQFPGDIQVGFIFGDQVFGAAVIDHSHCEAR